jgi:hypothetical protein
LLRADWSEASMAINPSGSSAKLRMNSIFMPVDNRAKRGPFIAPGAARHTAQA